MTLKVFEQICLVKPKQLFVFADAPRAGYNDKHDNDECKSILSMINWNCKVYTYFPKLNLGCGQGPFSAITWAFSYVNKLIILEDDCVPDISFFTYCQELLSFYENDTRISMISGNNFFKMKCKENASYRYSKLMQSWGWATWRRSWEKCDLRLERWPLIKKEDYLDDIFDSKENAIFWSEIFDEYSDLKDASVWDIQFFFSILINRGLCIIPHVNLVTNIGIEGTHFSKRKLKKADSNSIIGIKSSKISLPLRHPSCIVCDKEYDKEILRRYIFRYGRRRYLKIKLKKMLKIIQNLCCMKGIR